MYYANINGGDASDNEQRKIPPELDSFVVPYCYWEA